MVSFIDWTITLIFLVFWYKIIHILHYCLYLNFELFLNINLGINIKLNIEFKSFNK